MRALQTLQLLANLVMMAGRCQDICCWPKLSTELGNKA